MIPIRKNLNVIEYFYSKEFFAVFKEIYARLTEFNKKYLIQTFGIEAYLFLLFQRKLIQSISIMMVVTVILSLISTLVNQKIIAVKNKNSLPHIILLNNIFLTDFSTILHLISLFIFTILHFTLITSLKKESQEVYLERIINMSKNKDNEWLACRTLLISGIPRKERIGNFLLNSIISLVLKKEI